MQSYQKLKVMAAMSFSVFIGMAAMKRPVNEKFKNLQVLPINITEDSLDNIMSGFVDQLGVNCNYCHVLDKKADSIIYDVDDKPEKQIARNMMRMTMDINKKYFQFNETVTAEEVQAVTCFTCHKGTPIPVKQTEVKK